MILYLVHKFPTGLVKFKESLMLVKEIRPLKMSTIDNIIKKVDREVN